MRSRKRLRWVRLAALLFLCAPAGAQIVEVELRDAKAVHAQAKYVLELGERRVLRGESVEYLRGEPGALVEPQEEKTLFELFVMDPGEPEDLPYRVKDGNHVARSSLRLAEIPRAEIRSIRMIADDLILTNVAVEVHERTERIAALERKKKNRERESPAWFDLLFLQLENQRRLQILLERYGFEPAARKLDDEIQRLTKAGAEDPRSSRLRDAVQSIQTVEVPLELLQVSAAVSGDQDEFFVQQSQHIRIVHDGRLTDARVVQLLTLGEEIIEGFRREFVDPFECADLIPDRPFAEFFFGPDEDAKYERYYVEYYGLSWGSDAAKAHRLTLRGTFPMKATAPEYLTYYRHPEQDLLGLVAHRLGEQLSSIHFDARLSAGENPGSQPDWLREAVGVYMSLEYLGANTTSCTAFLDTTVGKAADIRRRQYDERPADYYRYLAEVCARPLDQLVIKSTGELGTADTAKGWCVLRFLAQEDGERGQQVLHSACKNSREKTRFLEGWRAELRGFYAVPEGDPIRTLEQLAVPAKKK